MAPMLELSNLQVWFDTEDGVCRAVDGVSWSIDAGETLGLVGESGCGKSITAFSILQLLPVPPARYAGGEILFRGQNILAMSEREMQDIRGNLISLVFQEPMSSLNPIMTIGRQVTEVLLQHRRVSKPEARHQAIAMLERVGIAGAETRFHSYPHQLSGGMKQRVVIAMALMCGPQLLIADEPTTALDVTIEAQILDLLADLKDEFGMSVLLITHNLGVVAETCDRVAVMYAGKIVETARVDDLFTTPKHPYTIALFRSMPSLAARRDQLKVIPGYVPDPLDFPSGCRFRTRCLFAQDICLDEPPLREVSSGHLAACHFADDLPGLEEAAND
jgi:peptide/nickel transport system ATP-binding protein